MTYGIGHMTPDLIDRAKRVLAIKQKAVASYEHDLSMDPTPQGEDLLRRAKNDLEQFMQREGAALKMLSYPGVLDD